MTNSIIKRVALVTILIVAIFAMSTLAVEKIGMSRTKLYFGLNLPYNSIGGDFDGQRFLSIPATGEYMIVPKMESGIGFGVVIGYSRMGLNNLGYGWEVSFQQSKHDYTWLNLTGTTTFGIINFDMKGIYASTPVELYLLLGLAIPWLKVEDGANWSLSGNTLISSNPMELKYTGFGVNIGAGLDLFLAPNISFGGRIAYRALKYGFGTGKSGKFEIGGGMGGSGINVCGSLNYHLSI